ncbi:MAG: YkgJ family cysteine cluster protein [Myxococcota bacterium]
MPLPLIADGIRFECQQSGKCCTSRGSYGFVYVTLADRRRLATHFGINTSAFTRRYCSKTHDQFHLNNPELDCGFLVGKGCSVYEARPTQCRTWPFWPENMNPRAWRNEVEAFCPGAGKGRLYSPEEIAAILAESE